jgi:hypothetical protein
MHRPTFGVVTNRDRSLAAHASTEAALNKLAVTLDPDHYSAELVTDDGPVPYLLVANRHAQLSEAVYADDRFYRWSWGQPIAAVGNPRAAAEKVSYVLAAAPEPARG